ncbi:MAG TPA: peptidylprolyl isomerase [Pirellulales bacterium]|jgi:parvulin-like peptidyl-prolyl isomerase|nr:peptidylprolyl isomerase [Pirellulales bacterium]
MNRTAFILTVIFLTAARGLGQGLPGPPPPDLPSNEAKPQAQISAEDAAKGIVARVNGTPIYQGEIQRAATELSRNQKIGAAALPTVEATILRTLIERVLVQQFLKTQKISSTEAEINSYLDRFQAQLKQQNLTLDDFLARTNQTDATLRAGLVYELGWKKFVEKNATDENLQEMFKRYHEQFDGTQRRVSHILLRPDGVPNEAVLKALVEQANQLRDDITSDKITFEAAAEKYSAGPSRSHSGDLGFIPVKGVMAEPFSQAAFTLKPGDISQPVVTIFGVHLIKVTDIKPGKKTWQDVRDQLQPAFAEYLHAKIVKDGFDNAVIEYAAGVPHFKKNSNELEVSESAPNLP